MTKHSIKIVQKKRFEFGKNWQAFLSTLDEERIEATENSLVQMLGCENLNGKNFLISGLGADYLAATRLGAKVHSFDYDQQSVACTAELKRRYYPDNAEWTIEENSVLDEEYMKSLKNFDIVYSWGVLHHTGNMQESLGLASGCVDEEEFLFIAVYNDQGPASKR